MIWFNGLLALASLLAVFKAPAKPLWFVAVGVTEWGHWMALVSVAAALVSWLVTRRWGAASWVAVSAALLYVTPWYRASIVASGLPGDLHTRFGTLSAREGIDAPSRSRPLDMVDLFRGIFSPPVRVTTVVYSEAGGRPLSMDLYQPSNGDQPLPCLLVVHGGSWKSGDRQELQSLNRYLAARGYVVASMDYRLAPEAVFPAQRDDVFSALAYLKEHARHLGVDKDRLVLLGRSAGGQIALSAAYSRRDPAIKGVIVFYTPNDLTWAYSIPANPLIMNSQKVIETYLGGTPDRVPGRYDAASPLHFVNAETPPTLMIHGVRDELVWAQHDERLSKRLTEAGRPYYYLRLPWATHGCDANFSGPSGQLSIYAVERFLAAVIPPAGEDRLAQERSPLHARQNQPA